ncbi:asparagine synthase-related protein [Amycolatopsis sp. NBC_00345]|uniref:asparagine synthase-related protein n=1 Tax=Amycolatopsis sp. NBC_00345 TaxID=2975955 RepID=UPI002E2546C9
MEFLVLPDCPDAAHVVVCSGGMRRLDHPGSGRPWVMGRWADSDLTIETVGDVSVVLLGCASVGAERLRCLIGRVRSVEDLDRLSGSLAGAFHLIGSIRGNTRVQGTVSTSHQVFHTQIDGVTVAADRPHTLARLVGAGIDEDVLALHLLSLRAPGNLAGRPLWRGVESLDVGEYLRVDPDGTGRVVRWWAPPAPEVSRDTGVKMVREALIHAVEARTSQANRVSADLSGGLDSTSLCFLTTQRTRDLLTTHYTPMDATNDDATWAERARTALPHARHVVFKPDESPEWYGDYTLGEGDLEGPYPVLRTRSTVEHLARQVSALGASRHLQGSGGDELFHPGPVWLHSLLRTRPLAALRLAHGARSLWRWTLPNTVRNLADQTTYPHWLNRCATRLTDSTWSPAAGWENVPHMPAWATGDAVSAARRLLVDAATTQPWSRLRIHHELLSMMRLNGHINRRTSQVTSRFGVSYEAPYIDDRVIEAVMAIRLEDRTSLTEYKPVLKQAMRGIVPDEILARRSKGDYSPHLYSGIRRHQQRILGELGPDSHLARLGLIDPDAVRRTLPSMHPDARTLAPADPTLACETWLRTVTALTDRRPA